MVNLADERLVLFRESGIPLAMLKGNHDMLDKGGRWHSYGGAEVWRRDQEPLWVFDKPGTLDFGGLCLAFLPYGSAAVPFEDLNPDGTNVLFFHDDVKGLSSYGAYTADGGLSPLLIDRNEFMLVLGGHVHLRQDLNLRHTIGYHIGSPLERIEDGDQGPKGALIIDFDGTNVTMDFVESPMPKVVRSVFSWKGDIEECISSVKNVSGNIIQLVITHTGSVPAGLRREVVKKLRERGVASVDVRLQAEFKVEDFDQSDYFFEQMLPLEEECVAWMAKQTDDKKLVGYTEQVIQRTV